MFSGQNTVVIAGVGADFVLVKSAVKVHVELSFENPAVLVQAAVYALIAISGHQTLNCVHRIICTSVVAGHVDDDVLDVGILFCPFETGEDNTNGIIC